MPAEYISIHPQNPQANKIEKVVKILQNGGVIIYPTDTVYGIGCDIHQAKAVERVCKLKNINPQKINLSFICHDLSHISEYTRNLPTPIFKLMKKALPGPFTFILVAGSKVPKMLNTKKNTIGIRIPDNKVTMELVKTLGNPLLSTSVPTFGDIAYMNDPELMYETFKNQVDAVIDSGIGGITVSTIVDCSSGEPLLQRQGLGDLDLYL
jgi:tRNA threonylcarbamoyl adenosine modification protein (Sua5/YciO/YrdC/YwlC family)